MGSQPPIAAPQLEPIDVQALRLELWKSEIQPRLTRADEACAASVDDAVRVLTAFFEERESGARPLAEAMLTLRSKWKLVVSELPKWLGGNPDAHHALLEKKFDEHVFTSEDIKKVIESAIQTYLDQVQSIENQLLVDIRADLADLPEGVIPETHSDTAFSERFKELAKEITPKVGESLGTDVAKLLAAWVGGEIAASVAIKVLAAVATRLGVSAGILGAGASASWATFGISVVAAIVVDQVVGRIIDWATDPVGTLEARIEEMLDDTLSLIVDGDEEMCGLRAELLQLNDVRSRVRSEAVRRIVVGE